MLAAFATLAFAATLWLAVVLLARMVEENGARMLAAAQLELAAKHRFISSRQRDLRRRTSVRGPRALLPALRAAA